MSAETRNDVTGEPTELTDEDIKTVWNGAASQPATLQDPDTRDADTDEGDADTDEGDADTDEADTDESDADESDADTDQADA